MGCDFFGASGEEGLDVGVHLREGGPHLRSARGVLQRRSELIGVVYQCYEELSGEYVGGGLFDGH